MAVEKKKNGKILWKVMSSSYHMVSATLKQVLLTTYTLDKMFFAAAVTFKDLWVDPFQADYSSRLKSVKCTLAYMSLPCIFTEDKTLLLNMKILGLACQSVNLFWKIAVYNAGCVFRLFLWRTQKSFLVKTLLLL